MARMRSRPPARSILPPARGEARARSEAERLADAQRGFGMGSYEVDLSSGTLRWAEETFRIHGLAPGSQEPDLEWVLALTHPDDAQRVRDQYERLVAQVETAVRLEYRIIRPDGEERIISASAATLTDRDGRPERLAGSLQDVTEHRRAERELARSERRQGVLIDQIPGIVYTAGTGDRGAWTFVSRQVEDLLGYSQEEWLAESGLWFDRVLPEDRRRVLGEEEEVAEGEQLVSEYRMVARDGRVIWVRDVATKIRGEDGVAVFQGVILDVSDRYAAEQALTQSEAQYRYLVETSDDLIWALDSDGHCTFVNEACRRIFGYEPQEMVGRPLADFLAPGEEERGVAALAGVLAGERVAGLEFRELRKDGSLVVLSCNAVPILDHEGNVVGATGTARDVTEARRIEVAVEEKHAQLQAIIDNSPLMIFAKDRDHRYTLANGEFEALFGLAPGKSVGLTEKDLLSPEEAARAWAINEAVMATGERRELEESIADPSGPGVRTFITQKFPLRDGDGQIYGMCAILTDITERKEREDALREKVEWSSRIREAVADDLFTLHAQPIIDLKSGEVVQEELLIRMTGQDGRLIMPGEFLPPAERFGLAPNIDRWVISKAAAMARVRRVEVNLSAKSMGDRTLPGYIEAELRAAGADPANVVFEITETAAAEDLDQARRLAERLTALGCGFALDDFGTGFGSFTYLKHLPVSYIKIDIDFVRTLTEDASNRQVVRAIVGVAHNFGVQTIAEGVESEEALTLLGEMGVDYAQGFHIGRPAPAPGG